MIKQITIALAISSALFAAESAFPAGIQTVWSQFQEALRQDSPESLAMICKFPLQSNEFGGTIKTAKVLKSRYTTIFTDQTKQCLLSQVPKKQKNGKMVYYQAFCDNDIYPIRYIFEQVGSKFYFVSIDNINE